MGRGKARRRWPVAGAALIGLVSCGTANGPGGTPPPVQAGSTQASPAVGTGSASQWVELTVGAGPLARNSGGFAYDPGSGRLLLSGGRHGCGPSATSYIDTWTLDGSTWQQQHPKNDGPGEMSSFRMAYDQSSRQVVALGVFSGCGVATGMFTWTGTDWVAAPQTMTLPDPSFSYTLTYDDASHQLLAVGSTHAVNASGKETEETWTWDGQKWTQLHPVQSPPPLADAAAAYDPASHRVILVGGSTLTDDGGSGAVVADTWAWDGINWTHLHPATSPPARMGAAMVTDVAFGRPILFGGVDKPFGASGATVFADTWAWVTDTWVQQHPAAAPTPRFFAQMAYDPGRKQIVLFGGALNESTDSDDVWVYRSH
jgi:hypothetical protein